MLVGGGLTGSRGFTGYLEGVVDSSGGRLAGIMDNQARAGYLTFSRLLAYARAFSALGTTNIGLLTDYLMGQAKHLLTGTLFLYTIGAIGQAFGDIGFFAEVVFQSALLAQVIVGTAAGIMQKRFITAMEEEGAMNSLKIEWLIKTIENKAKTTEDYKNLWGVVLKGKMSEYGLPQFAKVMLCVTLAAQALQIVTVMAMIGGAF
ncbi:MAG: hypothetical protein P1Q69_09485 [Candidatus Thorarchaeota archaeon]|nr:hypothetical protein [Candidatus Thorarchaeota archaeon]